MIRFPDHHHDGQSKLAAEQDRAPDSAILRSTKQKQPPSPCPSLPRPAPGKTNMPLLHTAAPHPCHHDQPGEVLLRRLAPNRPFIRGVTDAALNHQLQPPELHEEKQEYQPCEDLGPEISPPTPGMSPSNGGRPPHPNPTRRTTNSGASPIPSPTGYSSGEVGGSARPPVGDSQGEGIGREDKV